MLNSISGKLCSAALKTLELDTKTVVNSPSMGDLIGVKETFSQILKAGLTEDSEARNEDSLRIGDTFNHENQGDENVKK